VKYLLQIGDDIKSHASTHKKGITFSHYIRVFTAVLNMGILTDLLDDFVFLANAEQTPNKRRKVTQTVLYRRSEIS
jgi:hypothetical protein